MKNFAYAKLNQGVLEFAPYWFDGYYTTDPTQFGYKPVIETKPPSMEDGYIAVPAWTETATEIMQGWTVEPMPEHEATEQELTDALAELGVNVPKGGKVHD